MPLHEEFRASGDWLFRRRSYLPLALLLVVLVDMTGYTFPLGGLRADRLWELACFAVSLLGLAIRVVTVGSAPDATSGRNTVQGQIATTVNTTGLYSVVRHPLYVGNFLMYLGVAMLPRSAWLVVVVALAFWLYYERIMFAEEEFLRAKFRDAYEAWASTTPAFLPRLRGARARWRPPALPFSMRHALRREYSELFGLVACFVALDAVGESAALGRPHVDPLWGAAFVAALAVYLTLRTLKRHTRVLHVDGR